MIKNLLIGISVIVCSILFYQSVYAYNQYIKPESKDQFVICNVDMNQRLEHTGRWAGVVKKGEKIAISGLIKGALNSYNINRWWAIRADLEHVSGYWRTYRKHRILIPVTSGNGCLLNVDDPNRILSKLGLSVPELPDNAIKFTYHKHDGWNLLIRDNKGNMVSRIVPKQDFYVLDIVIGKFPSFGSIRKWGKIYNLCGKELWAALSDYKGAPYVLEHWERHYEVLEKNL